MKNDLFTEQRGLAKVWVILIVLILLGGAGAGGFAAANQKADETIAEKDQRISSLQRQLKELQSPSPQASATPQSQSGSAQASQSTNYQSANLGFTVEVPKEWAGKWRYQENGTIGISTASVTFLLINKETKYAEVVTIGKVPIDKYNDARASNQPIGNAENLLKEANGFAYVMTFADGGVGDYKDFTYAQATTAAKASFKSSFKTL